MKSDVRRTQARDHFIAFSLFPLGTSSISRNRHSHALRRSPFFLAAVRVPVHILDFCNTSQARIVFSSPHHRKCDRRPGFSPRAPNLQSSLLPLQSRMRNAALFWQFCRAHDFQDCDAPNPHESITFFAVSRFWHRHNCDSRARILINCQKWHPHARRGAQNKVRPAAVGTRLPTF